MKKGQGLILDGQSLTHIEVLLNSEGTEEGSLLQLLSRCVTPFGWLYTLSSLPLSKCMLQESGCFWIWLYLPLHSVSNINSQ
jgi:DNA mismatch repair protein MSH6